MKPRTKLQVQVTDLSKDLPCLKDMMLSWAKVDCLDHKGYSTKTKVLCMDCGGNFSPTLVNRKRAVCPHCNTKLKIEVTRKSTDKQHRYLAIATVCGEFQVIRNFELYAYYKAGKASHYAMYEILQHWILPNGKREVIARNHTINWYCDSWNGDLEIRRSSYRKTYDIYPHKLHPISTFQSVYKRCGINPKLKGLTSLEAITYIPATPKAETLLKAKQYDLLKHSREYNATLDRYWSSIKICMRNKYIVKDSKIWIDYLDLLKYFNRDLHNAHYVCPSDLNKEHDRLVAKKRFIQKKEDANRKRLKASNDEKKFKQLKSKFFGLAFSDGPIEVKMLESVQDYILEGDTLHHCVFASSYHLKPESLILSARIEDKPIETVEVSLNTLKVVQCRGDRNKSTAYHDKIIRLVEKNIHQINQRVTSCETI